MSQAKKATLLRALRKLKNLDLSRSPEELEAIWHDFNLVLQAYNYKPYFSYGTRPAKFIKRIQQIKIERISKFLGYPVQLVEIRRGLSLDHIYSHGPNQYFYPQKILNSYQAMNGIVWIKNKEWEQLKTSGDIIWCSYNKIWGLAHLFRNFINEKGTKLRIFLLPEQMDSPKLEICHECEITGYKQYFKSDPLTDHVYCPGCLPTIKKKIVNKIKTPMKFDGHGRLLEGEDIIDGYHEAKWNFIIRRLDKVKDALSLPMGLELELMVSTMPWGDAQDIRTRVNERSRVLWEIYKAQQAFEYNDIYFETDGSLLKNISFECITNPMTLGYHKAYWKKMLPVFQKYAVGWNTHKFYPNMTASYGIHITTHKKYWQNKQLQVLTEFFDDLQNQQFIQAIAQRRKVYGHTDPDSVKKSFIAAEENPDWKKKLQIDPHTGKMLSRDRYQSINATQYFVEFRMFQSTLNTQSFFKNLEFIEAMHNWTLEQQKRVTFKEFLAWLFAKRDRVVRYENLVKFLSATSFAVKGRRLYRNPWKDDIDNYLTKLRLIPIEYVNNQVEGVNHVPDNSDTEKQDN